MAGILRTLGLGDSISKDYERTALRRQGEQPGYIEALQQRASTLDIKILLLIKENQISQVKEFSAFVCMVRCKSLDSLKSFFSYDLSYLGPVSCVFHILSSSMLTVGSGCSLVAA